MTESLVNVVRGLVLLARFDAAGFRHLGGSAQDVLASLAPLVAFPLVFALLALLGGGDAHDLSALCAAIALLLLPLVTSEALARRWGHAAAWGRFAVAFNWTQWITTLAAVGVFSVAGVLAAAGLPRRPLAFVAALLVLVYQLGLHWFLARRGLAFTRGQAALLLLATDLMAGAMLAAFLLIEGALSVQG